jgi:hypothetical protein
MPHTVRRTGRGEVAAAAAGARSIVGIATCHAVQHLPNLHVHLLVVLLRRWRRSACWLSLA